MLFLNHPLATKINDWKGTIGNKNKVFDKKRCNYTTFAVSGQFMSKSFDVQQKKVDSTTTKRSCNSHNFMTKYCFFLLKKF